MNPSVVMNFSTLNAPIFESPDPSFFSNRSLLSALDRHIDAFGVKFAGLLLDFFQDLAQRFPFGGHKFCHQQAGENAVLLGT